MREHLFDILEGDDKQSTFYGRWMTVLIIVSLIPLCFWEERIVFNVIEYVCVTVFILDYIARWATADFKLKKGALSFVIYPFTPMAIIDLVTILPTFLALNPAWRTLRVLRLLRALRAFRLIRYSKSVNALVSVFENKRGQLLLVVVLAVAYILLSAMVMFNVEHSTFPSYFDALYWSVVSLTTVGYGDLYPTSDMGRVVAMISSFIGIAIVALPSGIIAAGLMEEIGNEGDGKGESQDDPAALSAEKSAQSDNGGE